MEDREHIGKMIVYLLVMLVAVTARVRAMGVLTDGEHAALYVASKGPDGTITFAKSLPLALNQGEQVHSKRCHGGYTLNDEECNRGTRGIQCVCFWDAGGYDLMGRLIAAKSDALGYISPNPLLNPTPLILGVLGHGRFFDVYKASLGARELP